MAKPKLLDAFTRKSCTITSTNPGYAKVSKWADGNPDGEERLGYFVTIGSGDGDSIDIASKDSKILGITVEEPGFSNNLDDAKYDEERGYLSHPYQYVALLGSVTVRQNGNCVLGGKCISGDDGIAMPSDTDHGYHVLEVINDTYIRIYLEPNIDTIVELYKIGEEIKKSLGDGMKEVADAITSKGILTAATETLKQMAAKIRQIVLGSGNAQPKHVLSPYTFTNDEGVQKTGTMPDKTSTSEYTATASKDDTNKLLKMAIPANGYYNTNNKLKVSYSTLATLIGLTTAKLAKDNTILGVTGSDTVVDTSSGDAANSHILNGKKAWVDGVLRTGTIPDHSSSIKNITTDTSDQTKGCFRVSGTTLEVVPAKGFWGNWDYTKSCLQIAGSNLATAIGLTSDKLVKGNTVLGVSGNSLQTKNTMDLILAAGIRSNAETPGYTHYNYRPTITNGTTNFTISNSYDGYATNIEVYSQANSVIDNYSKLTVSVTNLYMPADHPKLQIALSESTHIDAGAGDWRRYYLGEITANGTFEFSTYKNLDTNTSSNLSNLKGAYHLVFVSALGGSDPANNNKAIKYTISGLKFS